MANRASLLCMAVAAATCLGGCAYERVIPVSPFLPEYPASTVTYDREAQIVVVSREGQPLLHYAHGSTPVPEGIDPGFQRGDYVFALYGPNGEQMLDDYPSDHEHHRGINWAWATVKWKGETRDAFWVKGIWSRPQGEPRLQSGNGFAQIDADCLWMWDDKTAIVEEEVTIRVHAPAGAVAGLDSGYFVDYDLRFTPLVDDVEFCGRLEAGYSGFNLRMAPATGQEILFHRDPIGIVPRRAWADYSAEFPGGTGRSGVTLLQHIGNPLYPSKWQKYEALNFYQPLYPGGQPILMPKGETIRLRYRLWVHTGGVPDETTLDTLWTAYNQPSISRTP